MKKKKTLLCAINSKYIHSSPAVYYLQAGFNRLLPDWNIDIYESSVNDTIDHILHFIFDYQPEIIGFSVYIWNVSMVSKLCKSIRAINPDIKIILGGPEVSFGISHTDIQESDYDLIISGEGENAFPLGVCLLTDTQPPSNVQYSLDGKMLSSLFIKNLDEIPFIYNEQNISNFKNRIIYYESSRGCPFSCAYCLSSVCGNVRFLSLERVFSDIDFFIRHNVQQVKFVDRTFNCNPQRAYKIWEYIIRNSSESQTNFHFEIGADLLKDEHIKLLKTAPSGKIQLEIGIQSTNKNSLEESCRYAPTDKIFNAVKALRENDNINLHTDLIAGLPYESYERFKKSFNEVYSLKAHQLQLGFLKLLSGAPLNSLIKKHGYSFASYSPYEVLKNNYISYSEIQLLKEVEDVVEKFYNSSRFIRSLDEIEKEFKSPFDMFFALSEFLKRKELTFAGISTKKLYDILNEFSPGKEELLLKDFYLSENSEVVPESLKHLVPLNKLTRPASSNILHSMDLAKNKKVFVKFIDNKALVIDYSARNPVNNRFHLVAEKEVFFDE